MASPLKRLYARYNRRYFGNKLPHDMKVIGFYGTQMPIMRAGCYIDGDHHITQKIGRKVVKRIKGPIIMVRVGGRYDFDIALVLLHEMAHVSSSFKHGKRFQKEMLRLAKAGAFKGIW